ncbi:PREDICTED: L10-interacting MYB domain-containing protein-like [Nicotiana attenuata]|uniref:L10-interacting MYB domain-containing protein-like n=1 Tax=Nicotiana attenuata TaxID=49451 RepID=UPI000904D594|nr:PREDICTED: L10-interacting MYB domain-containing protein-like [Nicotiana attenuata]
MTLDNNSEKAEWDAETTELFLNICVEEILAGTRPGTHFSRLGWSNLVQKFNDKTGRNYDKVKLKNKWDSLKGTWKEWDTLVGKCNDPTGHFEHQRIVQQVEALSSFISDGIQGSRWFQPDEFGTPVDNEEFVNIDGIEKNTEKGFEQTDPEESNVIEKVRGSESGERRKRKASTAINEKEKNKFNTSLRITSSIEKIAEAIQSLSSMNMGSKDSSLSIKYVMDVVRNLSGMIVGSDLWWKASVLVVKQPMREMFLAKEDPELQLQWLKKMSELQKE